MYLLYCGMRFCANSGAARIRQIAYGQQKTTAGYGLIRPAVSSEGPKTSRKHVWHGNKHHMPRKKQVSMPLFGYFETRKFLCFAQITGQKTAAGHL